MKTKFDFSKLKRFLIKFPQLLAEKAFLVLVFLILIDFFLGIFVFYQYSFLTKKREVEVEKPSPLIKEEVLSKIKMELEENEKRFNETDLKIYPDLFLAE